MSVYFLFSFNIFLFCPYLIPDWYCLNYRHGRRSRASSPLLCHKDVLLVCSLLDVVIWIKLSEVWEMGRGGWGRRDHWVRYSLMAAGRRVASTIERCVFYFEIPHISSLFSLLHYGKKHMYILLFQYLPEFADQLYLVFDSIGCLSSPGFSLLHAAIPFPIHIVYIPSRTPLYELCLLDMSLLCLYPVTVWINL